MTSESPVFCILGELGILKRDFPGGLVFSQNQKSSVLQEICRKFHAEKLIHW